MNANIEYKISSKSASEGHRKVKQI